MSEHYESQAEQSEVDLLQEIEVLIRENPWAWQSVGALTGLGGGVLAPFAGALSDIITRFGVSEKVNFRLTVLSIVSCAMTLPLLALGGHCLDLLEVKTARSPLVAEGPPSRAL